MLFVGIDIGQRNTGFSIVNDKGKAIFSTNFGREIPKDLYGKNSPDFIKNAEQRKLWDKYLKEYGAKEPIGMIVVEGPDYGTSNVTQISIGSIHGVLWDYLYFNGYNFAIVTPKSINYAIFGTAKDITKLRTINEMKLRFPNMKIRDSNMADSLAMAHVARKFFELLDGGTELTPGEKEVLASSKKLKGVPKGLIYKYGTKYVLQNKEVFSWHGEEHKLPAFLSHLK